MTYDERTGQYLLSTGRRFRARGGVVGLDGQYTTGRYVCEGYDGYVPLDGWDLEPEDTPEQAHEATPWTAAEREELADEMIRRWTLFKTVATSRQ